MMRQRVMLLRETAAFGMERRGDTLIVTPSGETLEFPSTFVQRDRAAVMSRMREPGLRVLLVDLSSRPYFGVPTLAVVTDFLRAARDAGLEPALCGMSDDAAVTLRGLMGGGEWPVYRDRHSACRALTRLRWRDRLHDALPWAAGAGAVAAAVLLVAFVVQYGRARAGYQACETYAEVWADLQTLHERDEPPSSSRWREFRVDAQRRIDRDVERLRTWRDGEPEVKARLLALGGRLRALTHARHAPTGAERAWVERELAATRGELRERPLLADLGR